MAGRLDGHEKKDPTPPSAHPPKNATIGDRAGFLCVGECMRAPSALRRALAEFALLEVVVLKLIVLSVGFLFFRLLTICRRMPRRARQLCKYSVTFIWMDRQTLWDVDGRGNPNELVFPVQCTTGLM